VNSSVQEAEFAEGGARQILAFSGRSPLTAELLKDAVGRKADITFDRDYVLELKAQGRSPEDAAMTVQKEFEAMHPGWPRGNGLAAAAPRRIRRSAIKCAIVLE
jgi:hypothetical protein